MKRHPRKLKNYLIHREVQLKIILWNLLSVLLAVIATAGVIFYPLIQALNSSENSELQYHAAQFLLDQLKFLTPVVLIILLLVFVHQLLLTHHMFGPLINFRNTFAKISEGDLTRRIVLRKGDFLKDECTAINTMLERIGRQISHLKTNQENLHATLQQIESVSNSLEEIKEGVEKIHHEAEATKESLSFFKTGQET